jgi:putative heme-binding domain-containing protein
MENISRDFFKNLTEDERLLVLNDGAEWPNSALSAIASLPPQPSAAVLEQLIVLDKQLAGSTSDAVQRLQLGIIAILGRSQDDSAMAHLREIYEGDPTRRPYATLGLAQSPAGDKWPLLIRALPILDGPAAEVVLDKLMTVEQSPEDAESYRQVLLCGLRLKEKGGATASQLLGYWSGAEIITDDDTWDTALAKWQTWFRENHPDQPDPVLPVDSPKSKWTFSELTSYLESAEGKSGNPTRGALVFQQGQCIKCHRHGDRGESVGPDLTNIGRRFHGKEILQSIVYPSHVISDQYTSKAILTTGGRALVGMVGEGGVDRIVVLTTTGEKVELDRSEVEQVLPSKTSAMPEGLLDPLSLQQIADLFAFLKNQPRESITSRRGPTAK